MSVATGGNSLDEELNPFSLPKDFRSGILGRLRAFVLLSGSIRSNPFPAAIGRSILGLPVDDHRSLLAAWMDEASELSSELELGSLSLRVLMDRSSPKPDVPKSRAGVDLSLEQDRVEYRGSGGLLRDIASDYADDDFLLVGNGNQLLLRSLSSLTYRLSMLEGDISLVAHEDGTPSGLFLVRCGCVRDIAKVGFVDFKEQALRGIARKYCVKVLHLETPAGLPVRTRMEYLRALRLHYSNHADTRETSSPYREEWMPAFSIVEDGARVEDDVRLCDCVVLTGGTIGAGAAVVRSVVCPGGQIAAGQTVIDRIVEPPSLRFGDLVRAGRRAKARLTPA
ncbi:MAG: hypothetical protein U1D30_19015 [Planctomycetota bacterium]